jgi:hypothetical protein
VQHDRDRVRPLARGQTEIGVLVGVRPVREAFGGLVRGLDPVA